MSERPIMTFKVEERKIDEIPIQCKIDDKMKEIFSAFTTKVNSNLYDLEFYYNGKRINSDSNQTFRNLTDNNNISNININVIKRSKIIKCPKCICNNCIIKVENYKLKFSNCFHYGKEHDNTMNLLDYDQSQKIDFIQIECNSCEKNQNNYLEDFNKCLECSKDLEHARYYCHDHSLNHINVHSADNLIKYNEKYYYCSKHKKKFISYCKKHKLNLCEDCENEHKTQCNSKIKKFAHSLNLTSIKNQLKEIQQKTEKLKHVVVDEIKKMMNKAIQMIEKYQYIANDIIAKYELNNKNTNLTNYQVLKNIKNLKISNQEFLDDLNELTNQKSDNKRLNWISKCSKLIDIYYCYRGHNENNNIEIKKDYSESSATDEELEEKKEEKINNNENIKKSDYNRDKIFINQKEGKTKKKKIKNSNNINNNEQ